jgi:hypothetical protein
MVSIKQLESLKQLQLQGNWPPKTRDKADEILGRKKTKKTEKVKTTGQ